MSYYAIEIKAVYPDKKTYETHVVDKEEAEYLVTWNGKTVNGAKLKIKNLGVVAMTNNPLLKSTNIQYGIYYHIPLQIGRLDYYLRVKALFLFKCCNFANITFAHWKWLGDNFDLALFRSSSPKQLRHLAKNTEVLPTATLLETLKPTSQNLRKVLTLLKYCGNRPKILSILNAAKQTKWTSKLKAFWMAWENYREGSTWNIHIEEKRWLAGFLRTSDIINAPIHSFMWIIPCIRSTRKLHKIKIHCDPEKRELLDML